MIPARRLPLVVATVLLVAALLVVCPAVCRQRPAVVDQPAPEGKAQNLFSAEEVEFPADFAGRAVMIVFFSPG